MGDRIHKAVVIGTSAGGLYALTTILEKLPHNYPAPVIVVQHRSKEYRELLEEILQNKCSINIKQADEKEKIVPGRVYIAPPDYHLLVESDHTFSLSSDIAVMYSRPSIDVLFESAAEVYKKELIGIILTGANSDGANGIKAIRDKGGITIAQEPLEAAFPAMPKASIATGEVVYIWNLEEIYSYLVKLTEG